MNSTSIHRISADRKLSKWKRRLWYLLNWLNNSILPNWKCKNLKVKQFKPRLSEKNWNQIEKKSSPSRALSDLFWISLPWENVELELGKIHILDMGCGSGRYGEALQNFSQGRVHSYTGLDEIPHAKWQSRVKHWPYMKFHVVNSSQVGPQIPPETNFFVSQSAIEHFSEDLMYFRQVAEYINAYARPTIQIHMFPSAVCLHLYRFHGVRQYTPRTVSAITRLFPNSRAVLFKLGNTECNRLHFDYITKPVLLRGQHDRRETEAERYSFLLRRAIERESKYKKHEASFYSLIIHSNARQPTYENNPSNFWESLLE